MYNELENNAVAWEINSLFGCFSIIFSILNTVASNRIKLLNKL